jgi:transcription initiation factor TFIIB
LEAEFGRVFNSINKEVAQLTNTNSEDISGRYCNSLGLRQNVANVVSLVCQRARGLTEMASRTPGTIAGASIYMMSHLLGDPRSAKDIAHMVKVTESTVRQAYKILRDNMSIVMDESLPKMDMSLLPPS